MWRSASRRTSLLNRSVSSSTSGRLNCAQAVVVSGWKRRATAATVAWAPAKNGSSSVKENGGVESAIASTFTHASRSTTFQPPDGSARSPSARRASASARRRTDRDRGQASRPSPAAASAQTQTRPPCHNHTMPSTRRESHGSATASSRRSSGHQRWTDLALGFLAIDFLAIDIFMCDLLHELAHHLAAPARLGPLLL